MITSTNCHKLTLYKSLLLDQFYLTHIAVKKMMSTRKTWQTRSAKTIGIIVKENRHIADSNKEVEIYLCKVGFHFIRTERALLQNQRFSM